MTAHDGPEVDYAVPAPVPSSRSRRRERATSGPRWEGRDRTAAKIGCWVLAAVLAATLLLPVVRPRQTGADSPEAAVAQLLHGIADLDAVAVLAALDPDETADPARLERAYDRLSTRLLRIGDEVPDQVTAILRAAETRRDGQGGLGSLSVLAAVELDLVDLELEADSIGSGPVRVYLQGGRYEVVLEPSRLPDRLDGAAGMEPATYSMPLAEGWTADGASVEVPYFATVRRQGRWYVSLEASGDDLLGTR